jgi:hypothetical protein
MRKRSDVRRMAPIMRAYAAMIKRCGLALVSFNGKGTHATVRGVKHIDGTDDRWLSLTWHVRKTPTPEGQGDE